MRDRRYSGIVGIRGKESDGKSFPLVQAPDQKILKVVQIRGDDYLCAQIAEMGIVPGSSLRVRRIGAFCLVRVNKKRHIVSLGRKISEKIMVC